MIKFKLIVIALAALMVASCADKTPSDKNVKNVTRQIKSDEFCKVQAEGNFVINFTQDSVTSVEVSGRKDDVDDIKVTCRGGVLRISRKSSWGFHINCQEVYVNIKSPNLTDIAFVGSGEFNVNDSLDTDVLTIMQTGSGEVTLDDVICDRVKLELGGSGETSFGRLRCGSMAVALAGSGEVQCGKVQARSAVVDVAGSGSASLQTARIGKARFSVTGSGDIDVSGAEIGYAENNVSGSGDITIKGKVLRHKDNKSVSGEITVSE